MNRKGRVLVAAIAAVVLGAGVSAAQESSQKLHITAFAVNMSNIGGGRATSVDITIDSWSTAAEREKLLRGLAEKGQDELVKLLQKNPAHGRFRIPGLVGPDPHQLRLGQTIRYAWQSKLPEGGRRIVLAMDRYIGFAEAANQPRTVDYPITLIEMHFNDAGAGEGKLAVATQIKVDKEKRTLEIENYSSEPVRLNDVKVKPK